MAAGSDGTSLAIRKGKPSAKAVSLSGAKRASVDLRVLSCPGAWLSGTPAMHPQQPLQAGMQLPGLQTSYLRQVSKRWLQQMMTGVSSTQTCVLQMAPGPSRLLDPCSCSLSVGDKHLL